MQYWYDVTTGQVQTDEDRGADVDVLGPYDTAEEAARALETAHERTEKWDAEDRAWDQRGASPEGESGQG